METRLLNTKNILIMILIASIWIPTAHAATKQAASCSSSDVQSAIDAASDGDIVLVPAGSCTWTDSVDISKGITVQGAGIGSTIIRTTSTAFSIAVGTDDLYRVSGFSIDNTGGTGASVSTACYSGPIILNDGIDMRPQSQMMSNFRLDHLRIFSSPQNENNNGAICINGLIFGVIDNVQIEGMGRGWMIQGNYEYDNGEYMGDYAWTIPIDAGGPLNVYIEDSSYSCTASNYCQIGDGRAGGRAVLRYDKFTHGQYEPHAPQSYTVDGSRGFMYSEIYKNTWTSEDGATWISARFRGGTGILWDNEVIDPDEGTPFYMESRRACEGGGIFDCTSSYPCTDGFGRGPDQVLTPLYAWDNTLNGAPTEPGIYGTCSHMNDVIKENREYYLTAKPGWTPYAYPHPLRGGSCAPNCAGKSCGGDGCGGNCGTCLAGYSCNAQWQCAPSACVPKGELCGNGIDEDCDGLDLPCSGSSTITVDSTYTGYSSAKIDDDIRDAMGGTSTTWASAESLTNPHWVLFTFAVPVEISRVKIYWGYNNMLQSYMSSQQLHLQYWDGSSYMTAATINADKVDTSTAEFPEVSTTRLRLYQPASMGPKDYNEVLWITEVDYGACAHVADDDCDGCISQTELLQYIQQWKSGSITLANLMEAIRLWKQGC